MKHIKIYLALLIVLLLAISSGSARASVDIVNLSTQATGANPFVLTVGPNNTVVTAGYTCGCITIHNVSNKSSPVNVYATTTSPQAGAIVGTGNYVYVGSYLGVLQTWDLSSTTAPVKTNTYNFGGAYGIGKMRIVNGFLYVTTWQGSFVGPGSIAIFNLSTPSAPSLVSNTSYAINHSGAGDVLPIGNIMYTADYFGRTIKVYDITNKSSPQLRLDMAAREETVLSYKKTAGSFEPWRLLNKGNTLYVLDDDIIETFDISSSTNPIYISTTVAGRDVEGADIRGNLLYYSSSGVDTPETNKKIQIFSLASTTAPVEVSSKINGYNNYWLVLDSNGYYYTSMASDALVGVYGPIEPPTISTSAATNVASSSITLNASVTTNNNASTTDRGFFYGLTTGYGSVASSTGTFNIGAFSQNLSSLTCNTLYHYQVFATNVAGTATSTDQTFTTSSCPAVTSAPTVTLSAPTSLDVTSVTLNGSITSDGNASSTDRGFNYGLTASYGSVASTTGTFGNGAFSKALTGLTCATTYHYLGFAINSAGTGTTTDSTFTTSSCPVVVTPTSTPTSTTDSSHSGGRVSPQVMAYLLGGQTGGIPSTPVVVSSFIRSMTTGSSGSDVKNLQKYLNSKGFMVSAVGAGSPNNETNYFGELTRQALARFQKANNIYPPAGYFGPLTRAFITKNP